jgi:hypothetical protein
MSMLSMTILDPTSKSSARSAELATRPSSLDGLRVGLLHNTKPGGDILLRTIADKLSRDYKLKSIVWRQKPLPTVPASFVHEMTEQVDVVIAALAD